VKRSESTETTVQMPQLLLRADIKPDSVNLNARTVDIVFSTGAAVRRLDWMSGEPYLETLSMEPSAVRLDRLNRGAPFLDSHDSSGVGSVLGVVVEGSARIENGQGIATVRFSKRASVEPIFNDIKDRILRNVSVGYTPHRYEETLATKDAPRIRHAVDWEPYEISSVPIPADAGAQVRDAKATTHPCIIVRAAPSAGAKKESSMDPENTAATVEEETRAAEVVPNDVEVGATQERDRINGILNACTAGKMSMTFAQKMIDDKVPLVRAQGLVFDELKKRAQDDAGPRPGPSGVQVVGADPLDHFLRGIEGAILHRIEPSWFPLDDNSRKYRGKSVLRCAEDVLSQRGVRIGEFSRMEIAGMALGLEVRAGLHTTSDFPNILADVANKTLRRAYEMAPQTWRPLARQISMPDFKAVKRNQLGEAPALLKVLEHGEFTRGTVAEGKEQFQLTTYGRIFGITRQALVNDDLDAFSRLTMGFGRSARNLESDVVWYQILATALLMGDGITLFDSATHTNYTSSGTAIDVTSLGVAFALMMKQTSLGSQSTSPTYLNLSPRYLIVPPSKITLAMQYTTAVNPNLASSVNPWAGVLTPIAEPRLEGGVTVDGTTVAGSAVSWYLAASPDQIDIIEYGYLDGEEGPTVETRIGFDIDGLEIKCRLDFAAKVIDYRGLYKNAGA